MADLTPFNKGRPMRRRRRVEDFYNTLDNFFSDPLSVWSSENDNFKIDIAEKEDEYIVEAELPGVKKEEISLRLDDGRLTIAVQKEESKEEQNKNYLHKERRLSSMRRSIYLGDVKEDDVKAKLEKGVLYINIPRGQEIERSKQIPIE